MTAPLVTADQFVAHGFGDYVLQSDWMATSKTQKSIACLAHVIAYAMPFLLLTQSPAALAFIVGTHFIIDRWRLARFVCWAKNWLAPWGLHKQSAPCEKCGGVLAHERGCPNRLDVVLWKTIRQPPTPPWSRCKGSYGYPADRPPWLAMWLMVITDNLFHVLCNAIAIRWLG